MGSAGLSSSGAKVARVNEKSFDALAGWADAMHGLGDIRTALSDLSDLFGGDVAMIAGQLESGQSKLYAVVDRDAGRMFTHRNPKPFGSRLIEPARLAARPGSVWILSQVLKEGEIEVPGYIRKDLEERGIHDLALVVLERGDEISESLEIQFRSEFREHDRTLLTIVASSLLRLWRTRLPGICEVLPEQDRHVGNAEQRVAAAGDILATSNPRQLSRSEFRICALLRSGLLSADIVDRLDIRESTLRSHLRSIYAKTDTSGQVELMHKLVSRAGSSGSTW